MQNDQMMSETTPLNNLSSQIIEMLIAASVAKPVVDRIQNVFEDVLSKNEKSADNKTWVCPKCGCNTNVGNYCGNCGEPHANAWRCNSCGHGTNVGQFCENCGEPRARELWVCNFCGHTNFNARKSCDNCGAPKE